MTQAPQLIIFDCDGVLVDSERITNTVFAQKLNALSIPVDLDYMFEHFVGHSMEYDLALVEKLLGKPIPDGFVDDLRASMTVALQAELQPVDGIRDVLDNLQIPYCVASSGDHEKMRTTLGMTKLWSYFEGRIFSVTEVPRAKPYPDVFLYAAQRMGAAPSQCLVVEDTPTGVKAAVAAGMTVLGYAKLTPAHRLEAEGAITFDDMRTLPQYLQS